MTAIEAKASKPPTTVGISKGERGMPPSDSKVLASEVVPPAEPYQEVKQILLSFIGRGALGWDIAIHFNFFPSEGSIPIERKISY